MDDVELISSSERGTKRQKLNNGTTKPQRKLGQSRIFAPYRTVGLVSPTPVPFTSVPLGKTTFQITTSIGRSLQTYDLRKGLNLVFITRPQTPSDITASAAWKDRVLAAFGENQGSDNGVWVFRRGKKEAELEWPTGSGEVVRSFCLFGGWIVGVCTTHILVWKSETCELYTTLRSGTTVPFTPCMANLPTLLNKIAVGRSDGSVEIWNISTGKLVYTVLPPSSKYGAVTTIAPTPALDLVAIAYSNGAIVIQDLKADLPVIALSTSASSPATSISFRTDGAGAGEDGRKAGVMATASTSSGDVTLWDLNDGGRKSGTLRSAHGHPYAAVPGGVSKVEFLPGQAILVSTGLDNSLKTWIFDHTPFSHTPRILHERRGHGAPVTRLAFLPTASDGSDDTGKWLLSASHDRSLWGWSLRRDGQSTELSQGAINKKAKKQGLLAAGSQDKADELRCPPITAIACSLNRDGGIGALPGQQPIWQSPNKIKHSDAEISAMTGWESVLTAHENDKKARTWFWGRKRAGRWAFEATDGSNVSSVAISPCGTFGFVGSEGGGIDMFNLQSGVHRQRFPARLTQSQARQLKIDMLRHGLVEDGEDKKGQKKFYRGQGRHTAAVVGLAVDSLNRTVVSAGHDGRIKFWSFSTGLLEHELDWILFARINQMRFHRASELAAFACADKCIRVVDITTHKLIRELKPSKTPLPLIKDFQTSDFCFSADGQWIAASMEQLVLLWDLPTGYLVDAFKLTANCSSLTFSSTGEYLATATKDGVGVDIWTNRTLFSHAATRNIGSEELEDIVSAGEGQQVTASGENATALITSNEDAMDDDTDDVKLALDENDDVEALSSDLLSLSVVPRSRWQNLMHLDLIRERNKPIEPPKKPEKAPFFLPSLSSQQTVQGSAQQALVSSEGESRIARRGPLDGSSEFTALLQDACETLRYQPAVEHLKGLTPAAADVEIRSLRATTDTGSSEMQTFVQALTWLLSRRQDFELGQAWMSVFLKLHSDAVTANEGLRNAVLDWQRVMLLERERVQKIAGYCGGVAGWLRAARV